MALTITQTPAVVSLAQSPMIFTVAESSAVIQSSSFQYLADLYYWNGTPSDSGSFQYTLVKYPNNSLVGIFDMGRIINSTLTDLAQTNRSNVKYYAAEFYWQYKNTAGAFLTGSRVKSNVYKALDGYGLFQEPIGQQITDSSPHWPLMTDGPSNQNFLEGTEGWMTAFTGTTNGLQCDRLYYQSAGESQFYALQSSVSSSQQTDIFPITPECSDFPITGSAPTEFSVTAYSGLSPISAPLVFTEACRQKYPNIRIKWKNRYGQFDYFNFYMVNRQGFQSTKRTYQPQLGTWEGTSLSYNNADSSKLNYISDSAQTLSVNTDFINEDYNEIFKQLLVSDEIYWIYETGEGDGGYTNGYGDGFNGGTGTEVVRPITIKTDSIIFKTGVVDKTIQYGFDFDWGQSYKLII